MTWSSLSAGIFTAALELLLLSVGVSATEIPPVEHPHPICETASIVLWPLTHHFQSLWAESTTLAGCRLTFLWLFLRIAEAFNLFNR